MPPTSQVILAVPFMAVTALPAGTVADVESPRSPPYRLNVIVTPATFSTLLLSDPCNAPLTCTVRLNDAMVGDVCVESGGIVLESGGGVTTTGESRSRSPSRCGHRWFRT